MTTAQNSLPDATPGTVHGPAGPGEKWRVILVGAAYELDHALRHPAFDPQSELTVVGTVPTAGGAGGFPEQTIRQLMRAHDADTLVVVGSLSRSTLTLFGELAVVLGCRLLSLGSQTNGTATRLRPVWDATAPFGSSALSASRDRFDQSKRTVDVVLASVGLLVALPIIAVAALAVKLDSPGRAFFGHRRVGRNGQRFYCWKLRTMQEDAEQQLEDAELLAVYRANDFKLPNDTDPRITRIGRFLRKTSLDELPQLFNVLQGEMSLVGPRPIVAEELTHYRGEMLTLLSVRPGITGAWAVNGRNDLPYPQRATLELAYVRTRSFRQDLRILAQTIGVVLDPGFDRQGNAERAALG